MPNIVKFCYTLEVIARISRIHFHSGSHFEVYVAQESKQETEKFFPFVKKAEKNVVYAYTFSRMENFNNNSSVY